MTMPAKIPLLTVRNLSIDFTLDAQQTHRAVEGLSFSLGVNRTLALVGESGSGKSVTALAIMGLLESSTCRISPDSSICYRGQELLKCSATQRQWLRGEEMTMIFQEPMNALNPVFTIEFQLMEVIKKHARLKRLANTPQSSSPSFDSNDSLHQKALALLSEVGLDQPERRLRAYPHQLSGGQQQRVMIAMAIASEPRLLIADEPTTALDVSVQKQILQLLAQLRERRQMSMLFISHDLNVVRELADEVMVMRQGRRVEHASVEALFSAPQAPYTQALLSCRPSVDHRPWRLPVVEDFLEGRTPSKPCTDRPLQSQRQGEPLLVVSHLSKSYDVSDGWFRRHSFQALKPTSFELARGKTLGVVGESGSGKTTLALTLMRLLAASSGSITLEGQQLMGLNARAAQRFRPRMQMVFQNPFASLNPRHTTGQILMEPLQLQNGPMNAAARARVAIELLDKVGLASTAFFKYPHEFSGGQRQRIAIARCLSLRPDILICDEAVSALDLSVQAQLLNLLQDLQDEWGMSYIFISHDLAVVKYMSDEVMVMHEGAVVEKAATDQLFAHPVHPYTHQLLDAMPQGNRQAIRHGAEQSLLGDR